jgi:hypothetical protein
MALEALRCRVQGHQWRRQPRRDGNRRFILLTCRRCGRVETEEKRGVNLYRATFFG